MLSERPKASAVAVCCVSGWVWSGVGAGTDFGERFRREPGDGGRNGGSEPLEVDCRRSQESLDAHVVEAPPNGARKTVPGLGLAVDALDAPAVTLIEAFLPLPHWSRLRRARSRDGWLTLKTTTRAWREGLTQRARSGQGPHSLALA